MQPQTRLDVPEVADSFVHEEGGGARNIELMYLKSLARTLLVELDCLEMNQPHEIESGFNFNDEVQRFEVGLIRRALLRTGGNQRRAARLLGLIPTTLYEKIKRYGISIGREVHGEEVEDTATAAHDQHS
jgi:DNA-binding NtrC family response regulator